MRYSIMPISRKWHFGHFDEKIHFRPEIPGGFWHFDHRCRMCQYMIPTVSQHRTDPYLSYKFEKTNFGHICDEIFYNANLKKMTFWSFWRKKVIFSLFWDWHYRISHHRYVQNLCFFNCWTCMNHVYVIIKKKLILDISVMRYL